MKHLHDLLLQVEKWNFIHFTHAVEDEVGDERLLKHGDEAFAFIAGGFRFFNDKRERAVNEQRWNGVLVCELLEIALEHLLRVVRPLSILKDRGELPDADELVNLQDFMRAEEVVERHDDQLVVDQLRQRRELRLVDALVHAIARLVQRALDAAVRMHEVVAEKGGSDAKTALKALVQVGQAVVELLYVGQAVASAAN